MPEHFRLFYSVASMVRKAFYYIGIISVIGLIIDCFLPWTYYTTTHQTFTGFHVYPFANGNYYGKPGYFICAAAIIIGIFMVVKNKRLKQANVFLAGILLAYCIRTYLVFTNEVFEGEVIKKPGIYTMLGFSILIVCATVIPYLSPRKRKKKVIA